MINTDAQKIEKIVTRGVERVFPNEGFLKSRLNSGEQLTIYLGVDPTGPTLHMGHMIPLIKLAQLQELGHKIILLIGDFTARIGDPDKSQARTQLTHEQVLQNCKLYKEQASSVLKFDGENPAELKYNNDWLGKMNFEDVLNLASQMTVQRMLDRDMFRKRFFGERYCDKCNYSRRGGNRTLMLHDTDKSVEEIVGGGENNTKFLLEKNICPECNNSLKMKGGSPIYLHEFMYPLMQGYDSVAMDVDGEVGGNDQTFNMLVGRDLLKNQTPPKEKFVIPMKLLVDSNGDKMGKTTGNMLSFLDSADEKFKKIMTWTDGMILSGFELLTDVDLNTIQVRLDSDENPRDIKFDLAHAVVARFHGDDAATAGRESWINEVQKDNKPDQILMIQLHDDFLKTLTLGLRESKSQIKRLLKEGAIKINGEKVFDVKYKLNHNDTIKVGKKRWFRIN